MERINKVMELLYDREEGLFAMEELAAAAGAEVRQLQRILDQVERRGHRLEYSPDGGVRLLRPVALEAHLIERNLGTRRFGRNVICFEEVDSTNDVAFDSARQAGADGLVVLAESQRRGRGRMGRQWVAAPGANVLLSALAIDTAARLPHEALTIAAGLAVAEAVEDFCGLSSRLQWPNDVLVDAGKLAGVLVEVRTVAGIRAVVVGIGINVNWSPDELPDRPATNIAAHLGHPVERTELVRTLLRRLDERAARLERGEQAELRESWLARCDMVNRRVRVLCAGTEHVGRVLDVSPLEGLHLACDDGRRVHLPASLSTVLRSVG